jgi:hypothetical protein
LPYLIGCGDQQDRYFGRKSLFCHVLSKRIIKIIAKKDTRKMLIVGTNFNATTIVAKVIGKNDEIANEAM